jgi:hypothetical protein
MKGQVANVLPILDYMAEMYSTDGTPTKRQVSKR